MRGGMAISDGGWSSLLRIEWAAGGAARSAHHIENAGREAEQQKHNHSPGRNSEPAIQHPTERRANHDAGDEFGREPKAARHRRWIGGSPFIRTALGTTIGVDVAQLLAQSLEPSGKRSLVLRRLFANPVFGCVARHAFDTRGGVCHITKKSPPK